jgi:hypothetical protein
VVTVGAGAAAAVAGAARRSPPAKTLATDDGPNARPVSAT